MAPRQRHLTQPSLQDDISPSLVIVGASGAPVVSVLIDDDDDDDNDMMNHHESDNDKHSSKPLLIVGTKHGVSLVDTTTPMYPNSDESSYNTNITEILRDRHDIFNIFALVRFKGDSVVMFVALYNIHNGIHSNLMTHSMQFIYYRNISNGNFLAEAFCYSRNTD